MVCLVPLYRQDCLIAQADRAKLVECQHRTGSTGGIVASLIESRHSQWKSNVLYYADDDFHVACTITRALRHGTKEAATKPRSGSRCFRRTGRAAVGDIKLLGCHPKLNTSHIERPKGQTKDASCISSVRQGVGIGAVGQLERLPLNHTYRIANVQIGSYSNPSGGIYRWLAKVVKG